MASARTMTTAAIPSGLVRSTNGRRPRPSRMADPWVEPAVAEVDRERDEDDHERHHEHAALELRVIALGDRVEGEPAEAGHGKDRLDDHGPPEQVRELDTEDGHDRDERVLQRVPHEHHALAETLRIRGADVVLAQDLEQGGTRDAHRD